MKLTGKSLCFILTIASIIIVAPLKSYAECVPGMTLSKADWRSFDKIKNVVTVEPFVNQSKEGQEPWLSEGLAILIGDYLGTGRYTGVIDGIVRRYPPEGVSPNFIVSGAYQKNNIELRVFIKVRRPNDVDNVVFQDAFKVSPPDSGQLFVEMRKAVVQIFKNASLTYDKDLFEVETNQTSDYRSYESYIKGLEALWTFDTDYADVAKIWFQESIRRDVYFQKPYLALGILYAYQALMAKSEGKPYTHFMEKLEAVENDRIHFIDRPVPISPTKPVVKKKITDPKVQNRFLLENSLYIAAAEEMSRGNPKNARGNLEKSAELVPEDTVALNMLYQVYNDLGKKDKAEETLKKVSEEGICR